MMHAWGVLNQPGKVLYHGIFKDDKVPLQSETPSYAPIGSGATSTLVYFVDVSSMDFEKKKAIAKALAERFDAPLEWAMHCVEHRQLPIRASLIENTMHDTFLRYL